MLRGGHTLCGPHDRAAGHRRRGRRLYRQQRPCILFPRAGHGYEVLLLCRLGHHPQPRAQPHRAAPPQGRLPLPPHRGTGRTHRECGLRRLPHDQRAAGRGGHPAARHHRPAGRPHGAPRAQAGTRRAGKGEGQLLQICHPHTLPCAGDLLLPHPLLYGHLPGRLV